MGQIYATTDSLDLLAAVRAARTAIASGEVIVMPTDTVYGIAADAFSASAVQRLLDAKGRTRATPPPVLVANHETLDALAENVHPLARELFERFAPGPLTVILQARGSLQLDLGETNGTVALRIPDSRLARELLKETGPLAVSSANKHGEPAATTAEEALEALGEVVGVFLDGGPAGGEPSTIVDATPLTRGEPARIVRQGALSRELIEEVLGDKLAAIDAPEPETVVEPAAGAEAETQTPTRPESAADTAPEPTDTEAIGAAETIGDPEAGAETQGVSDDGAQPSQRPSPAEHES